MRLVTVDPDVRLYCSFIAEKAVSRGTTLKVEVVLLLDVELQLVDATVAELLDVEATLVVLDVGVERAELLILDVDEEVEE